MSPRPVGRRAGLEVRRCGCRAVVLSGLSSSGMDVTVDAAPLSPVGELMAVLDGVWTYTHHEVADELHVRGAGAISSRPAGTRPRQSVHPIHRCGTTWPALPRPPAPAAPGPDDPPPF